MSDQWAEAVGRSVHSRSRSKDKSRNESFRGGLLSVPHAGSHGSNDHIPYYIVDEGSSSSQLLRQLLNKWKLPKPSLVLSFATGRSLVDYKVLVNIRDTLDDLTNLDHFDRAVRPHHVHKRLSSTKDSITSVVTQSTDNSHSSNESAVWFLTSGLNSDPLVQFALNVLNERRLLSRKQKIIVIGCSVWDQISDDQSLDRKSEAHHLNYNHSHFLFSNEAEGGKDEAEQLMTHVQRVLMKHCVHCLRVCKQVTCDCHDDSETHSIPPVVMLAVGGGPKLVYQVHNFLSDARPAKLILYKGSGKTIDLLVKGLTDDKTRLSTLAYKPYNMTDEEIESLLTAIRDNEKRITVYEEAEEAGVELDAVILEEAFSQINAIDSIDTTKLRYQLALQWNRHDLAKPLVTDLASRSEVTNLGKLSGSEELMAHLIRALNEKRDDIAILWLKSGVQLRGHFMVHHLQELYSRESTRNTTFARLVTSKQWHNNRGKMKVSVEHGNVSLNPTVLVDAGQAIANLLDDQISPPYQNYSEDQWLAVVRKVQDNPDLHSKKLMLEFVQPRHELFLYAVLFDRPKLADALWMTSEDALGMALYAAGILKALSDRAANLGNLEISLEMLEQAKDYEQRSCSLIGHCNEIDTDRAQQWLVTPMQGFGRIKTQIYHPDEDAINHLTPFAIADSKHLMDFMGHACCQLKLTDLWYGELADPSQRWGILITSLCPPLMLLFVDISFKDLLDEGESEQSDDVQTRRVHLCSSSTDFSVHDSISYFNAVINFCQAPIAKFQLYALSHMMICVLFTIFVLVKLGPVESVIPIPKDWNAACEFALWIWMFTWVVQEMHQFFTQATIGVRAKLKKYFLDFWNILDMIIFGLFFLTLVFRFQTDSQKDRYSKLSYASCLVAVYIRITNYFYLHRRMGPKIIMIQEMLYDLMFFLVILSVFVFSFGAALQVVLYPYRDFHPDTLTNLFYWPYFQLFGELQLDNIITETKTELCGRRNDTNFFEYEFEDCKSNTSLAIVIVGIYMMLSNVLLINLLIALFTHSVESIQTSSEKVWRFHWYQTVYAFEHQPFLPTPFSILLLFHRLIMVFYRKIRKQSSAESKFVVPCPPVELQRMHVFVKHAKERYLRETTKKSIS